ncbi:uncharacterized protein LOC134272936 [Saccostrea cucullata]|uniref:uncharacterized protein LOC134232975 n=1 Tax=Saccostrea cuccullata TaxID=36930 RepID=UPI002ED23FEB
MIPEAAEAVAKRCNSMKDLREHPDIQKPWSEAMENVKRIISSRFCRIRFYGQKVEVTNVTTGKYAAYIDWKAKHCRERQYTFQIRKCNDRACCLPNTENCPEHWLPDPVLDDSGAHYKPYTEVKMEDTVEAKPRSSIVKTKAPKRTLSHLPRCQLK